MLDNIWIFVTQLCSVLVYIGIVFGLYRLLAAQKDATIQAKEATIENLQIRLRQIESKIPDILVTLLKDRLKVSQEELERLKQDKDEVICLDIHFTHYVCSVTITVVLVWSTLFGF